MSKPSKDKDDDATSKRSGEISDISYIHVRVPTYFKEDLEKRVDDDKTTITAFVTNTLEREIYKSDEEEVDEKEELIDVILTAMENLERRIEIRLGALQDTFNSLIGRLIDFDKVARSGTTRRRSKSEDGEDDGGLLDIDSENILSMDPETTIYNRVKTYIESKGREKLPEFDEIVAHLETDKNIKKYLDDESKNFPGWKESLITDAIDEAIDELAIPSYRTGGLD